MQNVRILVLNIIIHSMLQTPQEFNAQLTVHVYYLLT